MSDSDVLQRAAKALREAHTGENRGSGFTRARIMNGVHRERRRRLLRWAVFSPLASVLLVGSAWAQSTGKWPVIWKAVSAVFVQAPAVPETGKSSSPAASRPSKPAPLPEPSPAEPPLPQPEAVPEPTLLEPPSPPAEARPSRPRPRRKPVPPRSTPAAEPSPAPPLEPARDGELGVFRAAHDLHYAGRAREAVAAYRDYLDRYPEGRFVPEARYNIALDQIELGNAAAARDALEPFAAGRYGNYRRKEARELLKALP